MKNIDNYIKLVFDKSIEIETEKKNNYENEKEKCKRNKWDFDKEYWSEYVKFNPQDNIDNELLFNERQRMNFIDDIEFEVRDNIKEFEERAKYSAYSSELEYFKSIYIDLWNDDKLSFKDYYLNGKVINGFELNLEYSYVEYKFMKDVVSIKIMEIIKSKIDKLENESLVKNDTCKVGNKGKKRSDPCFDNLFINEGNEIIKPLLIRLNILDKNGVYVKTPKTYFLEPLYTCLLEKRLIADNKAKVFYRVFSSEIMSKKVESVRDVQINKRNDFKNKADKIIVELLESIDKKIPPVVL